MEGYRSALQAAGLTALPHLIARGEGTYEFGLQATEQWLALAPEQRPTAIVAVTDTMAIGAMRAIHSHGLMPGKDVAVIGFDDTPMARFLWPPLTTIRQPIREAGHKCVEMLVNVIEGRSVEPQSELLAPELIVRETG
jgi:DNA-binding LacI/PurR family transcriptional regulator